MASKKVGSLIKEARTAAGLTQEQLARKVKGVSATDISKAERSELDLTQDQLKLIAKATGVTQKSLLDAAKGTTGTAKKTSSTAKKTTTTGSTMKVTAAEKRLVELYRKADSDTKKTVTSLLKGESGSSSLNSLLNDVVKKFAKTSLSGLRSFDEEE